jgi:putative drug exporter of the RND superfamily
LLYRLGKFCIRHRFAVIGTWVAIAIAIAILAEQAGEQQSNNLTLPGTESTEATDLLDEYLPHQANGTNPVALEAPSGKLTDSANTKVVNETVRSLERNPDVRSAVNPLTNAGSDALSKDERIGYISVTLTLGPSDLSEGEAEDIVDATAPATDAGFEVGVGGYLGEAVSKPSTESSERLGLAAAAIILLFAFGTVVAMGLPIATAILGLVTGLSIIGLLGHIMEVPNVAPTLGTMLGLGVGIDYSLFIVTRHRQQVKEGLSYEESIAQSVQTSGGAVAFAGSTVIAALLSLAFANIPIVTALGITAAAVVFVAVIAALTLLPALLAILGPRIESLPIPVLHHRARDHKPHGWARWARWVAARPWIALVTSVIILAVLAAPVLDLRLGQEDNGELPTSTTVRRSYDLIDEGFGPGTNGPFLVAVRFGSPAHNDQRKLNDLKRQEQQQQQAEQQAVEQGEEAGLSQRQAEQQAQQEVGTSPQQQRKLDQQEKFLRSKESDPDLVHLENKIDKAPGVKSVSPAKVDRSGTAAVFTVTPKTAPSDFATQDLVNELRDDVMPDATQGTDLTAYVGGTTAGFIDLGDRIGDKLPSVILIVVAISFVLLMLAFRSLVVPLKAGIMNLLSIGASYGVVTAVFEKGWGEELIGLDSTTPVVSFVPLLMFAILFGLSMDYEVFLMTQIREHYQQTRDNFHSVIDGLATTGRIITSAALIMVCVFTSFVFNGDPVVKQFGVGLAVAIAVDATIVRCMLVPAVMVLMRSANWWLPGWLDRILPRISIETPAGMRSPADPRAARARSGSS